MQPRVLCPKSFPPTLPTRTLCQQHSLPSAAGDKKITKSVFENISNSKGESPLILKDAVNYYWWIRCLTLIPATNYVNQNLGCSLADFLTVQNKGTYDFRKQQAFPGHPLKRRQTDFKQN